MKAFSFLLVVSLLAGCALNDISIKNNSVTPISLRLSFSSKSGLIKIQNISKHVATLFRDAISMSATGRTEMMPPYPKTFAPEAPINILPGASLSWNIIVHGNELYPYTKDRGGIRLLGEDHIVVALYEHPTIGKLKSNEVIFKSK